MAIRSLKQLPKKKQASLPQIKRAKTAKPITTKTRVIGKQYGKLEISLGTHPKQDIAGVVKGFRRKTKADFGLVIKDIDGNVLARTHIGKGTTTIPEQLAVRAVVKYSKKIDDVTIIAIVNIQKGKRKSKKKLKK